MIDRPVTSAWSTTDARPTGVAVDAARRHSANIRPEREKRRLAGRTARCRLPTLTMEAPLGHNYFTPLKHRAYGPSHTHASFTPAPNNYSDWNLDFAVSIWTLENRLSRGRLPDPTWKPRPRRPRGRWIDQLRRDNNRPPADQWKLAISHGHVGRATLRSHDYATTWPDLTWTLGVGDERVSFLAVTSQTLPPLSCLSDYTVRILTHTAWFN